MRIRKITLFLGFIFIMSCSDNNILSETRSMSGGWHKDSIQKFTVNITDVSSPYNAYFVIRNNNEYPFQNIYLFTKIADKKGVIKTDTLGYLLARDDGSWIGTGLGGLKENTMVYKEKFKFPEKGKYSFIVQHGMRAEKLRGLEDVSFILEKEEDDSKK